MVEQIVVTLFPVAFLVVLFGGGERFRRRQIDMDGDAPINKGLLRGRPASDWKFVPLQPESDVPRHVSTIR